MYRVVDYVASHVLGGQCCVMAELMVSTSIVACSTGIVINGATCGLMHCPHHSTSNDDRSIRYTPWIRLDCSTWSFVFRTFFD